MKKYCAIVLTFIICIFSMTTAWAAPDAVAADAAGNNHDLIVITKPQNQKDSTFDSGYMISGYGKEGTVVTLYWYDEAESVYKKIYNDTQCIDENGASQISRTEATFTIGASGLFMSPVSLSQGANNILVYAENGDNLQLMKLSITKYNYNLFDIIESLIN